MKHFHAVGVLELVRWMTVAALVAAALLWLTGCASTTITYSHQRPDGSCVSGAYRSTKNIAVSVSTNGTLSIVASASEASDATTRLVKQVTDSVLQAAAVAK